MDVRRLDMRMALPEAPRRVAILGEPDDWAGALEQLGLELVDATAAPAPDVVVAPGVRAAEAIRCGAPAVLLEGRGARRALRHAGWTGRRLLPLPPGETPDLLLPLDEPRAARYALEHLRPTAAGLKRLRNPAIEAAIAARSFPELAAGQTAAARRSGPPFLLAAAAELGVPPDGAWFMTLGQGDALTRGVFHVFAADSRTPGWVVKFARVPGYAAPFERDERGLALVADAGGAVAAHAPRLLGRFVAGGLHASAETAVPGERLSTALVAATPRSERLALVERIAAWIVQMGRESAAAPDALEAERRRLRDEVIPLWADEGAPRDLVERVGPLPAVLQHNDLGTWNILADARSFAAVDWESARRHGFPLWDVLYFVVDALAILDGARTTQQRVAHAVSLLRGDLDSSPVLFRWVAEAARAAGVPAAAVGPVATLCWLHHGGSHTSRWAAADALAAGEHRIVPPAEQIAALWLSDPGLGADWPARPS